MNRLADKIFACFPPRGPDRPSWGPAGAAAPADGRTAAVPVLLAHDVAEHLFAGSPREHWDFRRDFADCTPPFPRFVVEMARPSRIYSSTMGLHAPDGLPDRWAWYLEAWGRAELAALPADRAQGTAPERRYRDLLRCLADSGRVDVAAAGEALRAPDPEAAARGLGEAEAGYFAAASIARELDLLRSAGPGGQDAGRLGWLLRGVLFVEDRGLIGRLAGLDLMLDRSGRTIPPPLVQVLGSGTVPAPIRSAYQGHIVSLLLPALLALSFVNRPGVGVRPCESPTPLDRGRPERGRGPEAAYFTLDIDFVAGAARN